MRAGRLRVCGATNNKPDAKLNPHNYVWTVYKLSTDPVKKGLSDIKFYFSRYEQAT